MTHPPEPTLAAFGLGLLEDPAAETVAAHMDDCPTCRRRVAELPADSFVTRMRQAVGRPGEAAAESPRPTAEVPPELAASGEYADVRELGRGGMGVVYLARNTTLDRLEVLKVVARSPDRFVKEIQAAARLKHPNVVGAYSARRLGGLLVFAMEYVPGDDLARLVRANGPLPVADACNYICQAARGLQHAHEQGMVHRDIKPSNLILTRDGPEAVVKILDFGLAKGTSETASDTSRTAEGAMLGTPDYVAPEQTLDAAKADIRADIYSLGCTLYYLLAGRPPFVAKSLYEVLRAHHSDEAVRLSAIRPDVPDQLAGVVAKMMAKDPARRFATPADAIAALGTFCRSDATVPGRRTRRRAALIGLAAVAATLIVVTGLTVKTPRGTIVLDGLPADAEVRVDGQLVTVTRQGDTATVTVARGGPYGLVISRGGQEVRASEASVTVGGRPVTVKVLDYQPAPAATPPAPAIAPPEPKSPANDRLARQNNAGRWQVDGDELIQSDAGADNCVLQFGDPGWTDYDFTFDAVKTGGPFGLAALFRADGLKTYYVFDLAGWQNRKYTIEYDQDGRFKDWVKRDRPGSMDRDHNYHVEVRARGDRFVCSIDGKVIYDVRDDRLARGGVGLRCWGGAVRVRSILVRGPDGTVLWKGPPDLPPAAGK